MSAEIVARPARTLRDDADREFWRHCEAHELRLPRCASCGKHEWPPAPECSGCGGKSFSWEPMSGRGSVRSFCAFERQYYPECPPPWVVILVELDEGPLFISDPAGIAYDELREGLQVRLAFIRARDAHGEFNLPVFERNPDV
jgi:uncharacterized OB-fold protein